MSDHIDDATTDQEIEATVKRDNLRAPGEAMTAEQFYETWRSAKYSGDPLQPWPYANHAEVCQFAEAYAAHVTEALTQERDALKKA